MTIIKYSIVAFRASYAFNDFIPRLDFDANTYVESVKLDTIIAKADVVHWIEWLGSTTWKTLTQECDELIISWIPTSTPEISGDKDSREVESNTFQVMQVLATATSHCFSYTDSFFFLSGSGELVGGKVQATDMRSFSRVTSFSMPFFIDREVHKEDPYFTHAAASQDWVDNYNLVKQHVFQNSLVQIREAYRSLVEGSKGKQLEFKIPNMVRAIECLIACKGAKDFADKVLWMLGTPPNDPQLSIHVNTHDKLVDLYQMRNDCSHGKEFGWSLRNNNYQIANLHETIGSYELLAEWAARNVFKKVLHCKYLQIFKDRSSLQAAWDDYKNQIPKG
jgi:hypothetical protein